jgi:signal transduction histidine kinase
MFARPDDIRDLEKVDLRSILMQSIEFCQAKTKRTVKSLTFDVARNFPEIISNSHSLLHTMVNLLINAAQSADKNDSWIKICVMQNEPSPDHIVIRVEDNGCGMASNTKQKIFDPFFTTKAKGVGTGLGLYISQSLINALGGYIKVESEPGKGSRFDVILPAKYTNTA